jgi:glucose/arabinose dehydrogenase
MSRLTRLPALLAAAIATAMALAGCGAPVTNAGGGRPTWVPKPDGPPAVSDPEPQLPGSPLPGPDNPGGGQAPADPGAPGQQTPGGADDPNVLATKLREPWGLALLPDGNAITGERTTGRILLVHADRTPPDLIQTIGGLDATGDGGLLGLALSPAYREDRLVFAYITTKTDNRVVKFELESTPKPVLTGIPKGKTGNGGRIQFGPDNQLYIGTGDAGTPSNAQNKRSLAGKILRVDEFGKASEGNPIPGSPVYSLGHQSVVGLCWNEDHNLFAVDNAGGQGEVNGVGSGRNYGWPVVRGMQQRSGYVVPKLLVPSGNAPGGDCAVVRFGLFVTSLTAKRLLAIPLDGSAKPGAPRALLPGTYGRLRTVIAAEDGSLWLTTSNRDGKGAPVATDDRVIRIVPPTDTTNSPV